MAYFEQRKNRWRARVRLKGHKEVSKTFRVLENAKNWARQVEGDIERGAFVDRSVAERTTLGEVMAKYLTSVTPCKRGADSESARLKKMIRGSLAPVRMSQLTSAVIAKWRDERLQSVSSSTVNRELNLLGHIVETAMCEWCIGLPANPVRRVRKPASKPPRDRRLTNDEADRLLAALEVGDCRAADGTFVPGIARNLFLKPIVLLAIETAMRQGELVSLHWEAVDLERRIARLSITKNGDPRSVPLSSNAVAILKSVGPKASGPVFGDTTREAVKRGFKRACRRAGIENFRFHDLRHEATSRLFERRLDPMHVAKITGHKTLAMLMRYTHPFVDDLVLKLA